MGPPMVHVIIGSCIAEVVMRAVLHPIDTLKSQLQYTRGVGSATRRIPILSDFRDGIAFIRREKMPVRAIYRGFAPSVIGAVPIAMVYMPTYEFSKEVLKDSPLEPLAAVPTGIISACARVPTSVLKAQLQLNLHNGFSHAIQEIMRRDGLRGLYVGFNATVLLDTFYSMVQFATLEELRWLCKTYVTETPSFTTAAIIGFLTGGVSSIVTEPIDVIRTRLMAQKKGSCGPVCGTSFGYNGLIHGLFLAARHEGVLSLWRGLLPRLILKSVGSSIWYAVYSNYLSHFSGYSRL